MKKILLVSILLIPLMSIAPLISYGGEPGFEYTIEGPAIFGVLTLVNQRDQDGNELGFMTVTFRGLCRIEYVKIKLCEWPTGGSFDLITPDALYHSSMDFYGPPDCRSECGGETIIITNVRKFKKTHDKIVAEVVVKFAIPVS
jgi:hypothetical protein